MRPKRVILLVDFDEQRQAENRFVLQTAGFKVVSCARAEAARKKGLFFDIIVAYAPVRWEMLERIAARACVRFLLVCPKDTGAPAGVFADAVLAGQNATAAVLIEHIKFGCARKRGPKPAQTPVPVERAV